MTERYMLTIRYIGTNYCGWQIQNNGISVQQTVIDALESVIGKTEDGVHGCSRTDSGVHAEKYVAHFDSGTEVPPENIVLAMNSRLPDDIAVVACDKVEKDFHARYSVKMKTYKYVINNSKVPDPFGIKFEYQYAKKIDEKKLDTAAKSFIGSHDFSGFCSSGSSVTDTVRTIYDANVYRKDDKVIFTVTGDGFLYNMVRIIVGTLLFVNEGKISADDLPKIILSKDRSQAGPTAPAYGLALADVIYEV